MSPHALVGPLLRSALADGLGSAAAAQIGQRDQVLLDDVTGSSWLASVRPAPPAVDGTTLFDVASLTKPMVTAAVAMALVSEGWLNLAWPIGAFFAGFPPGAIVADLLSHRAGCANHVMFYQQLWSAAFKDSGSDARCTIVELAHRTALAYPARQQNTYSDLGYIMMGALLERITGAPLDALFARWVAAPLQLQHARYIDLRAAQRMPVAAVATEVCERRGLLVGEVHDENCHAAGGVLGHAGLFATVDDVGRFAQAVLRALAAPHGTRVGAWRSDVVQQFFTPPAGSSWALGWDTPSTTAGISHAGDAWPRQGGFGHLGFTGTSLWLDVPRQGYVALLTNRVHPRREPSAAGIKTLRRSVGDAAAAMFT